jgi:hypothetical protein
MDNRALRHPRPSTTVAGSFAEAQVSSSISVDWRRVKGYKAACNIKKDPSWIWQHGYRLWNEDEHEFWLCRRCHRGAVRRPFPKGRIFQTTLATSAAALHLNKQHSLNETGSITSVRSPSKRQRIESWSSSANTKQEQSGTGYDYKRFRALLLGLVVADSIPFLKML